MTVNFQGLSEASIKSGDKLLISRGMLHDFTTESGAAVARDLGS